jgi:hypothetical protein
LIGLCSRACLSPGLTDQGSDTQDSTWILVQHFYCQLAVSDGLHPSRH